MRALVVALALAILGVAPTAQAQGRAIDGSGLVVTIPTGFRGGGFDPFPTATQLDSDEWIPFGVDSLSITFGGTCNTGGCARGRFSGVLTGLLAGTYSVDPLPGFVAGAGIGLQSGILGGTFHPGGLRFRVHNTESFSLRAAVLTIRWASNAATLLRNDIRARYQPGCDAARSIPLLVGASANVRAGAWEQVVDTYEAFDMDLPSMTEGCLELAVGTSPTTAPLGLSALFEIDIEFLPAACGDGIVETGEECERIAGSTALCACDDACRIPAGIPCDAGAGPCVGACSEGHCMPVPRTDSFPVPGCDDGAFCDGIERCEEGICTVTVDTLCVTDDPCAVCDEALDVCGAIIPGCCRSGDECVGPCTTGVCTEANVCERSPDCGDGGNTDDDASVVASDGSRPGDGSVPGSDAGGAPIDAGSSTFDAGETPPGGAGIAFGGGGGCRCAAAGRGRSAGPLLALLALTLSVLQRRRRRTRATPHASA